MRRPTSDARLRDNRRTSLDNSGNRRRNSSVPFQSTRMDRHVNSIDSETDFLCDRAVEFMESGDIHSIVAVELAEHSIYFERLLRYHKGRGYIRLPEFLNPGFASVLEFIRKGSTELTPDNIYHVFIAADFLLVPKLKELCCDFMHKLANDPSVAITLWLTGRELQWPEVGKMAFQRLLENFEHVWPSAEFTELKPMDLWLLLQEDGLNCKREKNVFEAIQRWITSNLDERLQFALDLLFCVRLGLLSAVEVEHMKATNLVQLLPEYSILLDDWPGCLTNPESTLTAACGNQLLIPRVPHEIIVVFGGWCDGEGPRAAAQAYNPRANTWTLWSDMGPRSQAVHYDWLPNTANQPANELNEPSPISPQLIPIDSSLTPIDLTQFSGAEAFVQAETARRNSLPGDGTSQATAMDVDNTVPSEPTSNASMPALIGEIPRRVYAGCCLVNNRVYLVGGFDGSNALKSTLCYDFEIDSGWYEISCMYEKRYYVSVAYADKHIYAVGGHNGENQGRLDSAERYNLEENLWQTIASMNRIRSDASAAELNDVVYVAGGFEGRRYHDSAEYYDAEVNQWTLISRMHAPRGGISLAQHGGYLYAIGGNDGNSRLRSIERYDPVGVKWEIVGQMNRRKSNLSSTVVNDDIYIIGGWSDEPESGILSLVERFDTVTRECHTVRSLTFAASATCACTLKDRNMVAKYIHPMPITSTRNIAPKFADFIKAPTILEASTTQNVNNAGCEAIPATPISNSNLVDQRNCNSQLPFSITASLNANHSPTSTIQPHRDSFTLRLASSTSPGSANNHYPTSQPTLVRGPGDEFDEDISALNQDEVLMMNRAAKPTQRWSTTPNLTSDQHPSLT